MKPVQFPGKDSAVAEVLGFILVFAMVTSIFAATAAYYVPSKATSSELGYQASTQSAMSKILSDILNGNIPLNGSGVTIPFPMGIPGVFFSQPLQTTLGLSEQGATAVLSYNTSVAYDYPSSTPISLINNTIAESIPISGNPVGIALDTFNENLYVISSGSSNLYEISSNNSSVSTITGVIGSNQYPVGIVFDPQNDVIYITVQSSNASLNGMVLYNTLTHTVAPPIELPNIPYDVAYDSSNGNIYVTTYYNGTFHGQNGKPGAGQVYALNPQSGSIISEIDIPTGAPTSKNNILSIKPTGISYDPSNGLLYVSMYNGTNLTVINPVTNQIALNIPINSSTDTAFDSANGTIYVTQSQTVVNSGGQTKGNISNYSLINGVDNHIIKTAAFYPKGGCPTSEVYDTSNHLIYMAGSASGTVTIFDGENNSFTGKTINVGKSPGIGPNSMIFDPYNGYIYVANFGSGNISVINGHTVTVQAFNPTKNGLPTTDKLTAGGELYTSGATDFVQPYTYILSNGLIAAENANNNTIGSIYGIPILVNQIGAGNDLSVTIMNISGTSLSQSSTQPIDMSFFVTRSQQLNLTVGQEFSIGSYTSKNAQGVITVIIDSIILNNFKYTINSSYSHLIDAYLYNTYNGSKSGGSLTSWQFPNEPLSVKLSGNTLVISLTSKFALQTLSIKYYGVGISF